jgi:hypothetical protein
MSNIWKQDLCENKSFMKGAKVLVLVPALLFLVFCMTILFGVLATAAYCVFVFVAFRLYDVYEERKQRADELEWEEGMLHDGWRKVSQHRWELTYWDDVANDTLTDRYFVGVRGVGHRPKQQPRRRVSYIVNKKRNRHPAKASQ